MPDKTSRAIKRLLARPGLHSVRFLPRGADVHVEGYSNDLVRVPTGVIVANGGERTLADAVDSLAAQAWDGGEPPDQLAEADARETERSVEDLEEMGARVSESYRAELLVSAGLRQVVIERDARVKVLEELVEALEAAHGHGPSSEELIKVEAKSDAPTEVQPRVWVGESTPCEHWEWERANDGTPMWVRLTEHSLIEGTIFVPGHHPRPTINPSKMSTIETCKEIWNG